MAAQQIFQMVIQAEQVLGPKTGDQKKGAVVDNMTAAAIVAGADNVQAEQVKQLAGALTDSTVSKLNTAGVFTKSTTQP